MNCRAWVNRHGVRANDLLRAHASFGEKPNDRFNVTVHSVQITERVEKLQSVVPVGTTWAGAGRDDLSDGRLRKGAKEMGIVGGGDPCDPVGEGLLAWCGQ